MGTRKLFLTLYQGYETAFLIADNKLIQMNVNLPQDFQIDDIFVGRVNRIIPSINAAFVQFTKNHKGFLPLSSVKEEAILNRTTGLPLKAGDDIIVQVEKEPIKTKDATLTCDISFQSENFVLMPYAKGIHYSKKFSPAQKELLSEIINDILKEKTVTESDSVQNCFREEIVSKYGLIIRTNAILSAKETLETQLMSLYHNAEHVLNYAATRTVFSKLYSANDFFDSLIRTYGIQEDTELITDQLSLYEAYRNVDIVNHAASSHNATDDFLQAGQDNDICHMKLYRDNRIELFHLYGLGAQIEEALSKKVWLKSGGYLIIEPTEALTVIDVNSGKAANNKEMERFHLQTNLEAAKEIARQIRLRNISGIIIIDFINLREEESNRTLIDTIKQYIKNDPVETAFIDMTKLGLMELTRKKTTATLREKLHAITEAEKSS